MNVSVVVPTLNSLEDVKECVASLKKQSIDCTIIVVANGTTDGTQRYLSNEYPEVVVLSYLKPLGFAGAVNAGILYSIKEGAKYIALLNNDAIADKKWLSELVGSMESHPEAGIITSKILHMNDNKFDSTGDYYTTWLLPYPRGRNIKDKGQYDTPEKIVSGSGGASIYRAELFRQVGLFDEDFFAYYEDVDISLRAHHAGWEVHYQPTAIVRHKIGGTSERIKGFTTLQTMKNLPLLYIRNVPARILLISFWKFNLAYCLFFARSVTRLQGHYALIGWLQFLFFAPKKLVERRKILSASKLTTNEFRDLLIDDLPPNARALRKLTTIFKPRKKK